jgi:hypothetical protein
MTSSGSIAAACRVQPRRRNQILDFDLSQSYIVGMTKLLDEAVEAVRRLPSDDQDDIARSKAAAKRGEFASEDQVRAVWAKHGL